MPVRNITEGVENGFASSASTSTEYLAPHHIGTTFLIACNTPVASGDAFVKYNITSKNGVKYV